MPREHRPRLGRYSLSDMDYRLDRPKDGIPYNGTVRKFQRWRKRRQQAQARSRRINRGS